MRKLLLLPQAGSSIDLTLMSGPRETLKTCRGTGSRFEWRAFHGLPRVGST